MAAEFPTNTYPAQLRWGIGLAALLLLIGLPFSPLGLPAHIQRLRRNFAEAERLHQPSCHDCGRPAVIRKFSPHAHSDYGSVALALCPQHMRTSTNSFFRLYRHWITVTLALVMFQILFPAMAAAACWKMRGERMTADELGEGVSLLFGIGGLVGLYLFG